MTEIKNAVIKAKQQGLEQVINYYFNNKTPKEFIKTRPGAAGMVFKYVTISYVIAQLNIAFGFNWEWKVIETNVLDDEVWLRGELTIKDFTSGNSISRSGVGGAQIKKSRETKKPLSLANDIKAADSDALKVAAAKFGIGADVKFKEIDALADEDQGEDLEDTTEAVKRITMNRMFAVAAERGFDAEQAKEKVKGSFKVSHMADLSLKQLELAIKAFETKPKIVEEFEPLDPDTSKNEESVDLSAIPV